MNYSTGTRSVHAEEITSTEARNQITKVLPDPSFNRPAYNQVQHPTDTGGETQSRGFLLENFDFETGDRGIRRRFPCNEKGTSPTSPHLL